MSSRARVKTVLILFLMPITFLLFCGSVALWGSWWRFPFMPTPAEWSAFFGASAVIALGFAWYQIRQVDRSNKSLIDSNELARHVNLESVRPRVQVALEASRSVPKRRGSAPEGPVFIAVRNIGVSPAHQVKLKVTPPFTSLEKFFKPGMMDKHFADVNEPFNGAVHFRTLNPGNTYIWFLGQAPDLFTAQEIPRRWEIEAEYNGTATTTPFHETFVIDLDIEKRIELPVDPLLRIGRDIEVVGDQLVAIKKSIPAKLAMTDETISALRKRRSPIPRSRAQSRPRRVGRRPQWDVPPTDSAE